MPVTTDFVTLDRFDESSRAGVEMTYLANDDESLGRVEAYAQFVDPVRHIGAYVDLPIAVATSSAVVGDFAAGGMFMIDTGDTSGLIIHAGAVLPTVGRDTEFALAAMLDRPHMAYQAFDSFSARISMSPIFRQGAFFGRIDLGLDLPLGAEQLRTMFHGGLGAGYDFTTGTIGAEIQLIRLFEASTSRNQALIDGAVSARLRFDRVEPYIAVALPIDDETRRDYSLFVTIGVAARLR